MGLHPGEDGGGGARRQFVAQFQQQALRGFLADAWNARQQGGILRRHGMRQIVHRQSGKDAERRFGTDAADLDQLTEGLALALAEKAVQQLRVLAHHELGQQGHLGPGLGQVVEGAHRHLDFVADPVDVHQQLRRIFFQQDS